MYDDIYNLKVGDIFMEDCYPEKYRVVRFERSKKLGMNVVIAKDIESGEETEWGYTVPAYAPCIFIVSNVEDSDDEIC